MSVRQTLKLCVTRSNICCIFLNTSHLFQVMQKSCRVSFMFGELTDKETISKLLPNNSWSSSWNMYLKFEILIITGRIDEALEGYSQDQFEILLYKKNSK